MITAQWGELLFPTVTLNGYERKPILHNQDYLYTEHVFHLRQIMNGAVVSKDFGGWEGEKNLAYLDQGAIDNMGRPRQNFTLKLNEATWFSQTAPDEDLGPVLLYHNMSPPIGSKSGFLDFGVRVCQRDPLQDLGQEPYILSNRWLVSAATDANFWQTRTVQGEAVLSGRKLAKDTSFVVLNTFLKSLFLPIAPGYKRELTNIQSSTDGLVVRYSFTDHQVPYVVVPDFVADADINCNIQTARASKDQLVMATKQANLDYMMGMVNQAATGTLNAAFGGNKASVGAAVVTTGLGMYGTHLQNQLDMERLNLADKPTATITIAASVSGKPYAKMSDLIDFAGKLAIVRGAALPGQWHNLGSAFDNTNKAAFVSCVRKAAGLQTSARTRQVTYTLVFERVVTGTEYDVAVQNIPNGRKPSPADLIALTTATAAGSLEVAQVMGVYASNVHLAEFENDGISMQAGDPAVNQNATKPNISPTSTGVVGPPAPNSGDADFLGRQGAFVSLVTAAISNGDTLDNDKPESPKPRLFPLFGVGG